MSQCDLVFQLLSQHDVQTDLGLREDQMAAVEAVWKQDFREIPNVTNILAFAQTPKGQQEHAALIREAGEKIDQYRLGALLGVMDQGQLERLRQILRQVEGYAALCRDSAAWAYLGLSAEQMAKVKAACAVYSNKRKGVVHRLGRQMIAGLDRGETLAHREKELKQLSRKVRAFDSDLDRRLSAILREDQKAKWNSLLGKPLHIQWEKGGPPLLTYY